MSKHPLQRRTLLGMASLTALAGTPWVWASSTRPTPNRPEIEVWKSPTCGCCHLWVQHLQKNGFEVKTYDLPNTAVKRRALGLPDHLGSCHTAVVAGYVIEGHVPAADIRRLLSEKPKALGLTVPGMPIGSPGMDGPEYQGRRDAYDVLLVTPQLMGGVSTRVFQHHPA